MRGARFIWLLAATVGVAGSTELRAADDPELADAKAKVAYFDKYAKSAKEDTTYAGLVYDLCTLQHPLTAERVGRILLREKDEEHHQVAAAVLAEFTRNEAACAVAGKALVEALQKGDVSDDVKDTVIDSMGRLPWKAVHEAKKYEYRPACLPICEVVLKVNNPYLSITGIRALGRLEDLHALPALLELFERFPVGYSWETGEVTVDTGAAGTADQEAAEAEWHAKYDSQMKAHAAPPTMFKAYVQELKKTLLKLTKDETIRRARDLRAWMEARREELEKIDIEIPRYKGPPIKEEDDKKKRK